MVTFTEIEKCYIWMFGVINRFQLVKKKSKVSWKRQSERIMLQSTSRKPAGQIKAAAGLLKKPKTQCECRLLEKQMEFAKKIAETNNQVIYN